MVEFDEEFYLEKYPDVAEAVQRGDWPSGFSHFCVVGKSKGRLGCRPVDATWYANSYPLVAAEIAAGKVSSPLEHYYRIGRFRGYLPTPGARRPANAAAYRSRCGGLWTDVGNALDIIAGRLDVSQITVQQATLLTKWVTDGYVVLPGTVPEDILSAAEGELDRAYNGQLPELRFAIHGISQHCPWSRDALTKPAKALDIHWTSDAVLELIFSNEILNFLHLVFERRVLATQTLGFWRGSAQDAHQDSAYVNYSLPMNFAASWIALEDVKEDAGELFYYRGSHHLPEFFYARQCKGAEEAKRLNPGIDLSVDYRRHIELIHDQAQGLNLETERFVAKRGDAFIWSADLAHGGGPISTAQTRKSVVTHYCPAELVPQYFEKRSNVAVKCFKNSFYSSAVY